METRVAASLRALADQIPAPSLPPDLWRRGRRWHWMGVATAAGRALLAAVGWHRRCHT
jgi:hypothetical protein